MYPILKFQISCKTTSPIALKEAVQKLKFLDSPEKLAVSTAL